MLMIETKKGIRPGELLYIILALLFFFQEFLQKSILFMQFYDEFITVCCIFMIISKLFTARFSRNHLKILLFIVLMIIIGLISNFRSKVQTNAAPILTDIGNCFKVFITYIGFCLFFEKRNVDKTRIIRVLSTIMKVYVIILFVALLLHETHIVEMGDDIRYGLRSFKFLYANAGRLSLMFYSIMLILTMDMIGRKSDNLFFVILASIVWLSTLRSRAFMYVLLYFFLYYKMIKNNGTLKLNFGTIAVILMILLFIAMDQIRFYFLNNLTARSNLLVYGIYTMKRFFPLGSGFATYGTDAATTYYSELYKEYGFNYVYGLSVDNPMFTHDTYWPAIFAQFGAIGTILMIILIYYLFKDILNHTQCSRIANFAAIFICIVFASASVATATFFHYATVGTIMLLPLLKDNATG